MVYATWKFSKAHVGVSFRQQPACIPVVPLTLRCLYFSSCRRLQLVCISASRCSHFPKIRWVLWNQRVESAQPTLSFPGEQFTSRLFTSPAEWGPRRRRCREASPCAGFFYRVRGECDLRGLLLNKRRQASADSNKSPGRRMPRPRLHCDSPHVWSSLSKSPIWAKVRR